MVMGVAATTLMTGAWLTAGTGCRRSRSAPGLDRLGPAEVNVVTTISPKLSANARIAPGQQGAAHHQERHVGGTSANRGRACRSADASYARLSAQLTEQVGARSADVPAQQAQLAWCC